MADNNWPSSVKLFISDGYSGGGGDDGVIRSRLGRASKVRPGYTTPPPEPVTGVAICTYAQLQTVREFYTVTLGRVLPFNHRDPTNATTAEYRFTGRPAWVLVAAGLWRVTCPLEQLTTDQGTFPLDIEGLST